MYCTLEPQRSGDGRASHRRCQWELFIMDTESPAENPAPLFVCRRPESRQLAPIVT